MVTDGQGTWTKPQLQTIDQCQRLQTWQRLGNLRQRIHTGCWLGARRHETLWHLEQSDVSQRKAKCHKSHRLTQKLCCGGHSYLRQPGSTKGQVWKLLPLGDRQRANSNAATREKGEPHHGTEGEVWATPTYCNAVRGQEARRQWHKSKSKRQDSGQSQRTQGQTRTDKANSRQSPCMREPKRSSSQRHTDQTC